MQVNITVLSVPDEPVITVPAAPTMLEDGILFVNGLSIYDGDVSSPSDEANFTVWLETTAGKVVLGNVSLAVLFKFTGLNGSRFRFLGGC